MSKDLKHGIGYALRIFSVSSILTLGAAAGAAPITVGDHSFENQVIPTGFCFGPGCITNPWVGGNDTGTQDTAVAGLGGLVGPVPDGTKTAFSNQANISQVLSHIIQANTIYTLDVDVGFWVGNPLAANPEIQLWNGNTSIMLGSAPATFDPNGWVTRSLVLQTGAMDPAIGDPIQIILSTGCSGCGVVSQIYWDNIRLDASPANGSTPLSEPGTLALFGLGFAAFSVARRRRKM